MKNSQRRPNHPGGILKRLYVEPLNISITQLSFKLKLSRKTLSKLVNERGAVTPDIALRLSRALSTTPELWLNLQRKYDLWIASHESDEWKEVEKIAA